MPSPTGKTPLREDFAKNLREPDGPRMILSYIRADIPSWILVSAEHGHIDTGTAILVGVLIRHSRDGYCQVTRQRLGELTHCTKRTIQRRLAQLAARGWIRLRVRNSAGRQSIDIRRITGTFDKSPGSDRDVHSDKSPGSDISVTSPTSDPRISIFSEEEKREDSSLFSNDTLCGKAEVPPSPSDRSHQHSDIDPRIAAIDRELRIGNKTLAEIDRLVAQKSQLLNTRQPERI